VVSQAVLNQPWNPAVHMALGQQYLAHAQTVASRQEYRRAEQLGGKTTDVQLAIGIALLIEGRDAEALELLTAAGEGSSGETAVYRAAAYARLGELEQVRHLAQSVTAPPETAPWFWYASALVAGSLEKPEQAIGYCQKALDQHPEFAPARLVLGQLFQQQGQVSQAEACFRQLYEQDRRNVDFVYGLASCLYQHGEYDEADRVVRQAFQDGVRASPLYEATGCLLVARGRYEAAARVFEKILQDPVYRAVAIENTVFCRFQRGEADELLQFIESLTLAEQELPLCLSCRGEIMLGRRGPAAAVPYLKRFAALRPYDIDARCSYLTAAMHAAQAGGADREGVPALLSDLARDFLNSGHVDLMTGRWALLQGDAQSALPHINSALGKIPQHAEAHFLKGEVLRQTSGARGCREMFEEWQTAIKLDRRHRGAWWSLAMAAAAKGNKERALDLVERAVRAGCRRDEFKEVVDRCR
jgi:Flp pilus assembly protein TadD